MRGGCFKDGRILGELFFKDCSWIEVMKEEKNAGPHSFSLPCPWRGAGRGSGELANHAVLPSVTSHLLPYAGVVTSDGGAPISLSVALGHILRRVASG